MGLSGLRKQQAILNDYFKEIYEITYNEVNSDTTK